MSHQESPEIKQFGLRISQTLYRAVEKEAIAHKMNVCEYVRFLIMEDTVNTKLTEEDYEIIRERVEAAARRLSKKGH